jgi:hypothetical protein
MDVRYVIVGVALIVGGLVQRSVHRDTTRRERERGGGANSPAGNPGLAGRWSSVLGFVAMGFGVVMVVAGFVSG